MWADCVFQNWADCEWTDWSDCEWDKFSIVYQDPKTRTARQFVESRFQNIEPIGGLRQVRHTRPGRQVETECLWLRYLDGSRWAKGEGEDCVGESVVWNDDYSDDEIDQSESGVPIAVTGGVGPYTWSVSPGDKFSVGAAETGGVSNTLNAEADACGTCAITVTDSCGQGTTGYVICTTGTWINCDTTRTNCYDGETGGAGSPYFTYEINAYLRAILACDNPAAPKRTCCPSLAYDCSADGGPVGTWDAYDVCADGCVKSPATIRFWGCT